MLQHELRKQKRIQESEERKQIALSGGNPDVEILRRKRMAQIEAEKQ